MAPDDLIYGESPIPRPVACELCAMGHVPVQGLHTLAPGPTATTNLPAVVACSAWRGMPHLTRDDTPNEGPPMDCLPSDATLAERLAGPSSLAAGLATLRYHQDLGTLAPEVHLAVSLVTGALAVAAKAEAAARADLIDECVLRRGKQKAAEAKREEGLGMLICAERDPDDVGARWAYDRALEDAARWIELGWPRGEHLGETMWQLAATLRTMRKHPEIADPMTYLEPFAEAVARDAKYAALLTAEAEREVAEWRRRAGAAG
jgi:hypothetical protein